MSGEGLSQRGAEFQLQPVPASKRKRSTANNETPRIWPAPQPAARAPLPATGVAIRLRRSQSVPNLKAKYSLDLSVRAQHCIAVPARLVHAWNAHQQQQQRHVQQQQQQQSSLRYPQQISTQPQQAGWSDVVLRAPPQTSKVHMTATASSAVALRVASGLVSPTEPTTPTHPSVYTPSIMPPINSQTLRELDLHEILKNPQLRHDLVFDADLQFRPNFDGERGRRKRDVGNKYWRAIQREIQGQCSCTSFHGNMELPCVCTMHRRRGSGPDLVQADSASGIDDRFYARIPSLIAELRCICLSILPSSTAKTMLGGFDASMSAPPRATTSFAIQQRQGGNGNMTHPSSRSRMEPQTAAPHMAASHTALGDEHRAIMQCLDPTLIMQQLRHGVLDVMRLITTIASILKQHCAPMRDPLIDSMVALATRQGDVTRSLRQCFEILELMKLDVANHQLSTSRVYLVDTAADFESRWVRDQVLKGKMALQRTIAWFNACLARQASLTTSTTRTLLISQAFDEGFLDLVFDPPSTPASRMAFNGSLASPCRLTTAGATGPQSPSSTAVTYPETFQFDAHRILTFHGEVTDISVVSMLLLLFRQLACSPQNLASKELPYPSSNGSKPAATLLSSLASAQQESVKSEIWTLLREAEAELMLRNTTMDRLHSTSSTATTSGSALPSPATAKPGGVASRVLDSRLSSWRKVVGDIVLQIAARAIQVHIEARRRHSVGRNGNCSSEADDIATDCKLANEFAPSQSTIDLLTRWLETNLHAVSPLFKLCRSRVRNMLAKLTVTSTSSSSAATPALVDTGVPSNSARKRTCGSDTAMPSAKRVKLHAIVPSSAHLSSTPSGGEACVAVGASPTTPSATGDLEAFMAEVGLLSERMNKVKSFHLQVFRCYYERLAIAQQHLQPPSTA